MCVRARAFPELLAVLLPIAPSSLLAAPNDAGSTALHWAALNAQLGAVRALVGCAHGPGADLIDIKNAAGRSPLGEAEAAGWDEGAKWMVEMMRLDDAGGVAEGEEEEEEEKGRGDTDGRAAADERDPANVNTLLFISPARNTRTGIRFW